MSDAQFMDGAATTLVEVVRNIKPDQLTAPTPCGDYDVRALVNHLLFWGPSLEGAGRKEAVVPRAAAEADVDLTDWADRLTAQVERTAAVWRVPGAYEGITWMGGPTELPSALVGGMVVGELVVHTWDLALATGQRPQWDDGLLRYTFDEVAKTVDQGRAMGMYGPEVAVPATASVVDRLVGLTGRAPEWTPDGRPGC